MLEVLSQPRPLPWQVQKLTVNFLQHLPGCSSAGMRRHPAFEKDKSDKENEVRIPVTANMGVSENSVTLNPMVLLIIIPFLNG